MLSKLVHALLGCMHTNYSFPRTTKPIRNSIGTASKPHTYVICRDCGKHIPYDWEDMKVVRFRKTNW
jgi:hypothetical protein